MTEAALTPAIPNTTIDRIHAARELVKHGTFQELCDLLIYADAAVQVSREKRHAETAREASRLRIEATRRVGELINQAPNEDAREKLWEVVPGKFLRCDELANIPQRLFNHVVEDLLDRDSSCTIQTVIRAARIHSLTKLEPEIYQAFDQTIWIKPREAKGATHIHYGGVEAARRKLGLRKHPNATRIDDTYSTSRILANQLSNLAAKLTGKPRELVQQAELKQAEVAELLDQAIKAAVTQP